MTEMNRSEFDRATIHGTQPVLIAYCAPWCGYCNHLSPALKRLSRQYGHTVTFGKIDIQKEPQLADTEQIEVVPTLVLYQSGNALGSLVVPECGAQIEAFLQEHLDI